MGKLIISGICYHSRGCVTHATFKTSFQCFLSLCETCTDNTYSWLRSIPEHPHVPFHSSVSSLSPSHVSTFNMPPSWLTYTIYCLLSFFPLEH